MAEETKLFPPIKELIGPLVVTAITWLVVTVIGLDSASDVHNTRLGRLESDSRECSERADKNRAMWHRCKERAEKTEAEMRFHHDHD